MTRLEFPTGEQTALRADGWSVSFDELHRLRNLVACEFLARSGARPKRVLGCLNDDETSLLALLTLTELVDYMPINPGLSDVEITAIAKNSGADMAVLSAGFHASKQHLFANDIAKILDWDQTVAAARARLSDRGDAPESPVKAGAGQSEGRLILHTSGSTGQPKRVPIALTALNVSAKNIALGHQLQSSDLALNALPTFHIGALVDVLLAPLSVGGAVSITDQRTPKGLVAALIEKRPTWVQIVPTILRQMVEEMPPDQLRNAGDSLKFIRSVTAPVPPDLKRKAEALLGCPVVEMYGMTETAGQIATNARDPLLHKSGSVGQPCNVPILICDSFGNAVAPGKIGEICVSGPSVFEGYEGIPKEEVFFAEWFRSGDLGRLDPQGNLYVVGRLKEMINVGGEKVSPFEIETAALLLPEVLEAAAYALPHPSLGEQVGLTIACRESTDLDAILAHLNGQLAPFKCPNTILRVAKLPRLANAKVDRLMLKRGGEKALAERMNRQNPSAEPLEIKDPNAALVARIWMDVLKCRAPAGEDDFFDMGGDSLRATQFLLLLEKHLGRDISPSQLFESPRFESLIAALFKQAPEAENETHRAIKFVKDKMAGWPGKVALEAGIFRSIGTLNRGAPLFWASQNTQETLTIAETLGQNRPFYFTMSLFRYENRTHEDFLVLAERLAQEIDRLQPEGEIAIGGFCGGASVMHFVAERLIEMGRRIKVFLSLDYWPGREVTFPMVHGMTTSGMHAACEHYAHFEFAQHLVHPNGTRIFRINGPHEYSADDLAPHQDALNALIDAPFTIPRPDPNSAPPKTSWSFEQRRKPPSGEITLIQAPRVFARGGQSCFHLRVKNTSDVFWTASEISGLSIAAQLLNMDNCTRIYAAGYAPIEADVAPGEEITLTMDVQFPDLFLPFWAHFFFVSQGVRRFCERSHTSVRRLVLPNLLRAKS
ncbi:MAG: AMP-binding protein [Paracoccaceae bacterium]